MNENESTAQNVSFDSINEIDYDFDELTADMEALLGSKQVASQDEKTSAGEHAILQFDSKPQYFSIHDSGSESNEKFEIFNVKERKRNPQKGEFEGQQTAEKSTLHWEPAALINNNLEQERNHAYLQNHLSDTVLLKGTTFVASVGGMSCSACVNAIEKHMNAQPGILACSVSLTLERADIEYDPLIFKVC